MLLFGSLWYLHLVGTNPFTRFLRDPATQLGKVLGLGSWLQLKLDTRRKKTCPTFAYVLYAMVYTENVFFSHKFPIDSSGLN